MVKSTNSHALSEIHTLTSPYSGDKEFNEIITILLYSLGDIGTKAILSYTLSQGGGLKEKLQHYLSVRIVSQKGYIPATIYAFISNPEFGFQKKQENQIISHRNFYEAIQRHESFKITFLKLILNSISKNPNTASVAELFDPRTGAKSVINKNDMKFYIDEILGCNILIGEISKIADFDIHNSAHTLSTLIRAYSFDEFEILSSKIDFSLFTAEFIFLVIDELFQFLIPSRHSIIRSLWTKSDIEAKLLDDLDCNESESDYKKFFQLISKHSSTIKSTVLKKILNKLNGLITRGLENKKTALLDGYNSFIQGNIKPQILQYDTSIKRFKHLSSRKSNTFY